MKGVFEENKKTSLSRLKKALLAEARAMEKEDLEINKKDWRVRG